MKKIMLSQPMRNIPQYRIKETKDKFLEFCESNNYKPVNSLFSDEWYSDNYKNEITNISLHYLSKSLEVMSTCDAVYFAKDWEKARGCKIEFECAKEYGLIIIFG